MIVPLIDSKKPQGVCQSCFHAEKRRMHAKVPAALEVRKVGDSPKSGQATIAIPVSLHFLPFPPDRRCVCHSCVRRSSFVRSPGSTCSLPTVQRPQAFHQCVCFQCESSAPECGPQPIRSTPCLTLQRQTRRQDFGARRRYSRVREHCERCSYSVRTESPSCESRCVPSWTEILHRTDDAERVRRGCRGQQLWEQRSHPSLAALPGEKQAMACRAGDLRFRKGVCRAAGDSSHGLHPTSAPEIHRSCGRSSCPRGRGWSTASCPAEALCLHGTLLNTFLHSSCVRPHFHFFHFRF